MIRIEKLTQSYCLNDINCTLPSGKLIGIMGANGAGKSTLYATNHVVAGENRVNTDEILKNMGDWPLLEKERLFVYLLMFLHGLT